MRTLFIVGAEYLLCPVRHQPKAMKVDFAQIHLFRINAGRRVTNVGTSTISNKN